MTREDFDLQMGRMLSLKAMPGDTDEYFAALVDIPDEVLVAAVSHALKTRTWFPVAAELRADADAVVRRQGAEPQPFRLADVQNARQVYIKNPFGGRDLALTVTKDWRHDCDVCEDTGWAQRFCGMSAPGHLPETIRRFCERRIPHAPHAWVERCACFKTNPTIQRRQAAQQRYSQAPERVGA
jgi:hypothetical protein